MFSILAAAESKATTVRGNCIYLKGECDCPIESQVGGY